MIKSNKSSKAVSTALLLAILTLTLNSFVYNEKTTRKIILTYCIPVVIGSKNFNIIDSTSIIYKENTVIYEMMPNHKEEINKDTLTVHTVEYKYFIMKKGEKYGFFYNSLNTSNNRKLLADSLLKKTGFLDGDLFKNKNEYSLCKTIKNKGKYAKIEVYLPKLKKEGRPDTTLIYYSKELKNIPYSLSESLDSSTKMKVCKFRFAFNAHFDKVRNVMFPISSHWFSIKEDTVPDLTKYDVFIDAFNDKYKQ